MNHVVLGHGEVGSAIARLLDTYLIEDPAKGLLIHALWGDACCLHVCFPYSEAFIETVKSYQYRFDAALTIIHSTVPIGTCAELDAVSSPVRGQHPDIYGALRVFVKYFGGPNAKTAAEIFKALGVLCRVHPDSRTIEAMKLWDTTQLGWMVLLEKEIYRFCQENGLDFETVYRDANETYNAGYQSLGKDLYRRPVLKHVEGPIGGHCVLSNARLLQSWIAEKVLDAGVETRVVSKC